MQIRAAVLEEFGRPLVVEEVDLAEPKAGEVLVRLAACGICHTDMYTASGVDPSGYAPCVLGHEGAGVVEAVGEGVSSLAEGDHVVTLFSPQCGECVNCRRGETLDVVPRYLITGRRILGASFGGVKGREQVPQLVDRYLAGDVDVDSFVSHRITLDDVNRGFELMEAQDGIRSVVEYA